MLGPTKKLLFSPTIFNAYTSLLQPRALSARESKLLLDIITNSFRRQLDHEHGPFDLIEDVKAPTKRRRSSQSEVITNRHIRSILSNPLLRNPSTKHPAPRFPRDPVEIFDDACAKGLMTFDLAARCLVAKKNQIINSSMLSVPNGMNASGLGRKVLQWFLSSHDPDTFDIPSTDFRHIFFEFLVAENMQTVIWTWLERHFVDIERLHAGRVHVGKAEAHQAISTAIKVLYAFVRAETKLVSLDSGFAVLNRSSKMVRRLPSSLQKNLNPEALLLSKAARPLLFGVIRRSNQDKTSEISLPSTNNYEFFIDLMSKWQCHLATARLWLDHPTKPDISYALKFLKSRKHPMTNDDLTAKDRYFCGPRGAHNVVLLAISTASRLLESEQQEGIVDIEWIISMLQDNYADILGVDQKKAVKQAKAEAASLALLDDLQLT